MRFDGGELDHGCRSVGVGFVVAGQASMVHEPAEGAFDDPAAGLNVKAARHHSSALAALEGPDGRALLLGALGRSTKRAGNVWCSWYAYYENITEEQLTKDITASTSSRSTTAGSSRWGTGSRTTSFPPACGRWSTGSTVQGCVPASGSPRQRDHLPGQYRLPMARVARTLRSLADHPQTAHALVGRWHLGDAAPTRPGRCRLQGRHRLGHKHRLHLGPRPPAGRRSANGTAAHPVGHIKGGRGKISSPARALASAAVLGGGGAAAEALGRSRGGGLTTKLQLRADGKGRPLSLVVTPGQRADCTQFEAVMDKIRAPSTGPGSVGLAEGPTVWAPTRHTATTEPAPVCASAVPDT